MVVVAVVSRALMSEVVWVSASEDSADGLMLEVFWVNPSEDSVDGLMLEVFCVLASEDSAEWISEERIPSVKRERNKKTVNSGIPRFLEFQ